jgi:hypothetical protein
VRLGLLGLARPPLSKRFQASVWRKRMHRMSWRAPFSSTYTAAQSTYLFFLLCRIILGLHCPTPPPTHTCRISVQAVDAATGFNRRVTEGKLAAKLVAKKSGVASWAGIQTMLDLEVRRTTPVWGVPSL